MKPWLASVGAVVAGFIVTALASVATDAVMHAAGVFPSASQLMSDSLFAPYGRKTPAFDETYKQPDRIQSVHVFPHHPFQSGIDGMS